MKHRLWPAVAVLVVAATVPAIAHHSFAAEFDRSKAITLQGTVTKVEWANPHARFLHRCKRRQGQGQ
jgi:hypothetical protein